jgi:hypothetical protein
VEHLSPHGLLFVALQLVVVVVLALLVVRHHARHAGAHAFRLHGLPLMLVALFALWYGVLRVQPARMGGDPFAYSLGIFDGVTLAGVVFLLLLHVVLVRVYRRQAASGAGKTL